MLNISRQPTSRMVLFALLQPSLDTCSVGVVRMQPSCVTRRLLAKQVGMSAEWNELCEFLDT